MNQAQIRSSRINEIEFTDKNPQTACLASEVIKGLKKQPRTIPPKYFYDKRGSQIFDSICDTDEYYLTRTEVRILEKYCNEIAELAGTGCVIVEPGSGSSQKVRILLDELKPQTYLPMDISRDYLKDVAQQLANEYPWLNVHAACIDYTAPIDLSFAKKYENKYSDSKYKKNNRKIVFFPGSSIGNFEKPQAKQFLNNMAEMLGSKGGLLIGVDLKKNPETLHAAYNDTSGITAEFNLNLLTRINRELGANFDLGSFSHHAFYNKEKGRVEMHLVCDYSQTVSIDSEEFHFKSGESIHTENSYKYHIDEFQDLAAEAGFTPVHVWTDEAQLFSIHFLEVNSQNNL